MITSNTIAVVCCMLAISVPHAFAFSCKDQEYTGAIPRIDRVENVDIVNCKLTLDNFSTPFLSNVVNLHISNSHFSNSAGDTLVFSNVDNVTIIATSFSSRVYVQDSTTIQSVSIKSSSFGAGLTFKQSSVGRGGNIIIGSTLITEGFPHRTGRNSVGALEFIEFDMAANASLVLTNATNVKSTNNIGILFDAPLSRTKYSHRRSYVCDYHGLMFHPDATISFQNRTKVKAAHNLGAIATGDKFGTNPGSPQCYTHHKYTFIDGALLLGDSVDFVGTLRVRFSTSLRFITTALSTPVDISSIQLYGRGRSVSQLFIDVSSQINTRTASSLSGSLAFGGTPLILQHTVIVAATDDLVTNVFKLSSLFSMTDAVLGSGENEVNINNVAYARFRLQMVTFRVFWLRFSNVAFTTTQVTLGPLWANVSVQHGIVIERCNFTHGVSILGYSNTAPQTRAFVFRNLSISGGLVVNEYKIHNVFRILGCTIRNHEGDAVRFYDVRFLSNSTFCMQDSRVTTTSTNPSTKPANGVAFYGSDVVLLRRGGSYSCYGRAFSFDADSILSIVASHFSTVSTDLTLHPTKGLGTGESNCRIDYTENVADRTLISLEETTFAGGGVRLNVIHGGSIGFSNDVVVNGNFFVCGVQGNPSVDVLFASFLAFTALQLTAMTLQNVAFDEASNGASFASSAQKSIVLNNVVFSHDNVVISSRKLSQVQIVNSWALGFSIEHTSVSSNLLVNTPRTPSNGSVMLRNVSFGPDCTITFTGSFAANRVVILDSFFRSRVFINKAMFKDARFLAMNTTFTVAKPIVTHPNVHIYETIFTGGRAMFGVHDSTMSNSVSHAIYIVGSNFVYKGWGGRYVCYFDALAFADGATFILNKTRLDAPSGHLWFFDPVLGPRAPAPFTCHSRVINTEAGNGTSFIFSNLTGLVQGRPDRISFHSSAQNVTVLIDIQGVFPSTVIRGGSSGAKLLYTNSTTFEQPNSITIPKEVFSESFPPKATQQLEYSQTAVSEVINLRHDVRVVATAKIPAEGCGRMDQIYLQQTATVSQTISFSEFASSTSSSTHTASTTKSYSLHQLKQSNTTQPTNSATTSTTLSIGRVSPTHTGSVSPSISPTASVQLVPPNETVLPGTASPTPPPSREGNAARVTLQTILPSAEAADAVTGSVAATGAVASSVSPMAGTNAARLSAMLRLMECHYTQDDTRPSFVEHPVQFPAGDNPSVRYWAGSAFVSSMFVFVNFVAIQFLMRVYRKDGESNSSSSSGSSADEPLLVVPETSSESDSSKRKSEDDLTTKETPLVWVMKTLGVLFSVTCAYFPPNIVGSSVTVFFHAHGSHEALAAAGFAVTVTAFVLLFAARGIVVKPLFVLKVVSSNQEQETSEGRQSVQIFVDSSASAPRFCDIFGGIFDGAKFPDQGQVPSLLVRSYFFEDVLNAMIISALAGIRPSQQYCTTVAVTLTVVALFHVVFLIVVSPYRSKLEQWLTTFFASTQVLLAGLSTAAISNPSLIKYVAVVVLVQAASFFVQAFVLAVWAIVRFQRRKLLLLYSLEQATNHNSSIDTEEMHENPQSSSNPLVNS